MSQWFEVSKKLPKEKRLVLVQLSENREKGMRPSVVAGYLKYAAGDRSCPYFVTIGCLQHSEKDLCVVTHWNDCLGDNFKAPLWENTFNKKELKKAQG